MKKEDIIEALAEYYGVGTNTDSYEWNAGCYKNGKWFSLNDVVEALLPLCEDEEW